MSSLRRLQLKKRIKYCYACLILLFLLYFKNTLLFLFGYNNWVDESFIYEKQIRDYESNIIVGLGDNGAPAFLPNNEILFGHLSYSLFAINTLLSDKISLHRLLKDPRDPKCSSINYNLKTNASIVIAFYNEPFSTLLRTVWSIIDRTPRNLLHEIILVDDGSDLEKLGKWLEWYIKKRFAKYPVKLIRSPKNYGLVNARLMGARNAKGHVLVFMDANCECTNHWVEPLLAHIEADHKHIAIPVIDRIDAKTLAYVSHGYNYTVGGFLWNGQFHSINIQKKDQDNVNKIHPILTPTMSGDVFAIKRSYFWNMGSYDKKMSGSGGENLEMSFRLWQCGGRLHVLPCSRVGHILRKKHGYKAPSDKNSFEINTVRTAKVWMDEYADLMLLFKSDYVNSSISGDLTHRYKLRNRLSCQSFSWYLLNVYNEKFIYSENVHVYGQLKTRTNRKVCAFANKIGHPLMITYCDKHMNYSQYFSLTEYGQLRQDEHCIHANKLKFLILGECQKISNMGRKEWVWHNMKIQNEIGQCISYEWLLLLSVIFKSWTCAITMINLIGALILVIISTKYKYTKFANFLS